MYAIMRNESKVGGVADTEHGVGGAGGVEDPYDSDRSDAETVAVNWEDKALSEASTVIIDDQDLSGF